MICASWRPILVGDEIILHFRNVTSGYVTDIDVLRDVSFDVRRGWLTSIIGSNGAGKSTVLRTIFGFASIKSGTIVYRGRELRCTDPSANIAQGIAYVAQGRCNFPMMSVLENLKVACFTLSRTQINAAVSRILSMFPLLRQKAHQMAGNLSGGQQQILEMAMALVQDPRLLLIDEPTLGLSPKFFDEVFEHLQSVREAGVSVLMVEQNAARALQISDWALVFELGRLFREGPAHEILADPLVKQQYLGGHGAV